MGSAGVVSASDSETSRTPTLGTSCPLPPSPPGLGASTRGVSVVGVTGVPGCTIGLAPPTPAPVGSAIAPATGASSPAVAVGCVVVVVSLGTPVVSGVSSNFLRSNSRDMKAFSVAVSFVPNPWAFNSAINIGSMSIAGMSISTNGSNASMRVACLTSLSVASGSLATAATLAFSVVIRSRNSAFTSAGSAVGIGAADVSVGSVVGVGAVGSAPSSLRNSAEVPIWSSPSAEANFEGSEGSNGASLPVSPNGVYIGVGPDEPKKVTSLYAGSITSVLRVVVVVAAVLGALGGASGSPALGGVSGVAGGGVSSPGVGPAPPRRPGIAASSSRLASTPTAPPTVAASPAPSTSSCSGAYIPLAIAFCATFCAASVPASTPPDARARLITPMALPAPPGNAASAISTAASIAPGRVPSPVAADRCSSVAPDCSARVRASPAPDATPRPIPAPMPTGPKNANGAIGNIEPRPSPICRPNDCSYPGAASNGALAVVAMSLMAARADFSVSSGNSALIPVPALSNRPTAPGINPLPASLTCPKNVVSGGGAGRLRVSFARRCNSSYSRSRIAACAA